VAAIPVLIVDDRAQFRRAAAAVVAVTPGFELRACWCSGEDAVAAAPTLGPGVILMDITMDGIGGIEATRRIAAGSTGAVVILMSSYLSEDLPGDVRSCGATAYVSKPDLRPETIQAAWARAHPEREWSRGAR
jgi:DNA-binding NarL/FixJ family response regulator